MAKKKKTRTILCLTDEIEKRLYNYCEEYGIKDKDIASFENRDIRGGVWVNIYCTAKQFDQIAFKLDLYKYIYWM